MKNLKKYLIEQKVLLKILHKWDLFSLLEDVAECEIFFLTLDEEEKNFLYHLQKRYRYYYQYKDRYQKQLVLNFPGRASLHEDKKKSNEYHFSAIRKVIEKMLNPITHYEETRQAVLFLNLLVLMKRGIKKQARQRLYTMLDNFGGGNILLGIQMWQDQEICYGNEYPIQKILKKALQQGLLFLLRLNQERDIITFYAK